MPKTHVRVLGGGNTYVVVGLKNRQKVEFLASMNETPPAVVGTTTPIQGIGDVHPVEIATGYAAGAGQLSLDVYQTWEKDGWVSAFMTTDKSSGAMSDETGIWDAWLNGEQAKANSLDGYPCDIYEIMQAQRMNTEYISVQKIIKNAQGEPFRIKTYHGCVITGVSQDERIENATMVGKCTITMQYTHYTIASA